MDSILRFATSLSSVENFARDVYIKSNLTIELDRGVKQLIAENAPKTDESRILLETPSISLLCDILEAIFLHGLKEKLSSRVSNVFGGHHQPKNTFSLDFWPIVQVLCHNEESRHLKQLGSISTDIGRCRAWLRSALNEGLFRSYFDTLICDSSLLNNFYRSSAYIRDTQHTEMMRQLIIDLESFVFHLSIDNVDLNCWSNNTLNFLGVSIVQDDSLVVTALDAIHLISEDKANKEAIKSHKHSNSTTDRAIPEHQLESSPKPDHLNEQHGCQQDDVTEATVPIELTEEQQEDMNEEHKEEEESAGSFNLDDEVASQEIENEKENSYTGNSLSSHSGWSTQPVVPDESYDAILESYSSRAGLSSTPDINDVHHSISNVNPLANATNFHPNAQYSSSISAESGDFEIIPKNELMNNTDADNQKFFDKLSRIAQECGLDEQDYKCHQCSRPIGMIYGKSRLCHIDGHLYCTECHTDEESIIPAQIIYNWNFRKFPIARHNKKRVMSIETEPIFDIKLLSPLLYSVIDEMAEVLELRTQLFFLHAYLFTCQESVAVKMRKMVWPREHLFEHIHLYSINDLLQVYNNTLAPIVKQVINFARAHVMSCALCKLKGYYCEICKGSQILYPFDTDSTQRCENCKSVFHIKCFDEKYDKHSCPKCLRMAKKKNQSTNFI